MPETLKSPEILSNRPELPPQSLWDRFLDCIHRPDIKEILPVNHPWAFVTTECYEPEIGLFGAGGLGVLADDVTRKAKNLGVPIITITPFYPQHWTQKIDENLNQTEVREIHHPSEYGFTDTKQKVNLKMTGQLGLETTEIEIWKKDNILVMYHLNLNEVYAGSPSSDLRLFQQMVGGWAGMHALLDQKKDPGVIQLNEGSSVFAALAYMDQLVKNGETITEALEHTKDKTILTNHTLVPAAWNKFTQKQLNKFLYANIQSPEVMHWINKMLVVTPDHKLDTGDLALLLAGKQNGVSVLHADIASHNFIGPDGKAVYFHPVTNGIDDHWIFELFQKIYQQTGLFNELGLPAADMEKAIAFLRRQPLREIKNIMRQNMRDYLKTRQDQYGHQIEIPDNANTVVWARRFADYKRPELIFKKPDLLADKLEKSNSYLIMAGRAHPDEKIMKIKIHQVLKLIDENPRLKKRVIFVENYNPELAEYLNAGADIAINTPIKGNEACGTSIFKLIANLTRVISTRDGGLADSPVGSFSEIIGTTEAEEIDSLYEQLALNLESLNPGAEHIWQQNIIAQLKGNANKISGARMIADYLNFFFPKPEFPNQKVIYHNPAVN
jgi:glycogen phosphorylase